MNGRRDSGSFIKVDSSGEMTTIIEDYTAMENEASISPTDFVKQLGFPVYEVTNFSHNKLHIWVGGCNGTIEDTEKHAEAMNSLIDQGKVKRIDIGIDLGDRCYPSGFKNFGDYYKVYANPHFPHIFKTPILWVSGNHDAGRQKDAKSVIKHFAPFTSSILPAAPNYDEIEMSQVLHAYEQNPGDPKPKETKIQFYSRKKVDFTDLPKVFMPALGYSLIFDNVQIFIINTNNLVKDFFALIKKLAYCVDESDNNKDFLSILFQYIQNGKIDPSKNQAASLLIECHKAREAGKTILFGEHHPWFTSGKRAYISDAMLYLGDDEMRKVDLLLNVFQHPEVNVYELQTIVNSNSKELSKLSDIHASSPDYNNYNTTTKRICFLLKVIPDLLCVAHDHFFSLYNNKVDNNAVIPFYQLTNGSNDTERHQRVSFAERKNVGAFSRDRTETIITVNIKNPRHKFKIDAFVHGAHPIRHLKFFTNETKPNRFVQIHLNEMNRKMEKIRKIVLAACDKYQKFLGERQIAWKGDFYKRNTTHKSTQSMDEIINLLNQFEPYKFEELCELIKGLENIESEHSLYRKIYKRMNKEAEYLGEELIKKLCPTIPKPKASKKG